MARIQVSFKNNDAENKLYQEVMKAYDKSAFIKECIRFYLDKPMIFREILKEIIMEKPERFYLNY